MSTKMSQLRKSSSQEMPVIDSITPAVSSPIDYRTLVKRSRYDQIEGELAKLKARLAALEEHHYRAKSPTKSGGTETKLSQQPNDQTTASTGIDERLSQALVNIEDDLHRILYILLHQYEVFNRRRHRKHSKPLMIAEAPESRASKTAEASKEQHNKHNKLSKDSRAISQPNLSRKPEEEKPIAQSTPIAEMIMQSRIIPASKPRSQSSERRKSLPAKPAEPRVYHCHYHITKPDVHWILGTSPNPSFSMMARKQIKLATLKQHGPLCLQSFPIDYSDAPEERSRIISRVQSMINDLQLEYDKLYRRLQFQQSFEDQSEENSVEIPRLSNHLIHIMDQLVELHQLNKSFLC